MSIILENLNKINETIKLHAQKSGNNYKEIEIVAVTKGRKIEEIKELLNCGVKKIGENRVQEAREKKGQIGEIGEWHLVGHLQTNKVKIAVEIFDLIHSVDSLRLAKIIDEKARAIGKVQKVLIQVNTSGEQTKFGISPEEVEGFISEIYFLKNISIDGLMTIAPFSENPESTRKYFRKLREIFEKVKESFKENKLKWLSMGMSQDYHIAVEEGANLLRIGTAIFERRS